MDFKKFLLFGIIIFFSVNAHAQRSMWDGSYNRLGIQAGANYFNIVTNDFQVTPKVSWTAGFTTRASFYENWQLVYGVNFYDYKLDIEGREKIELTSPMEAIEYNMIGVQGNFFASYKLYEHYLSVELGPVVQVNGKLDARQDKELWYIGNYNVNAIDIEKISAFNVNMALGLSGGMETLKFWVQYQYGLNNMLKGLDDEGLEEKDAGMSNLKGHMSMLAGGVTIFL